jgi:hypothetical protein
MTWLKHIFGGAAVLGIIAVASLPFSSAAGREDMGRNLLRAKTPADHQASAAFYEKEAQTARGLSAKHFLMRDVYAAARAMERKDRAGEHCAFVAKKYQAMAKEYETLAAIHKMVAEQLK